MDVRLFIIFISPYCNYFQFSLYWYITPVILRICIVGSQNLWLQTTITMSQPLLALWIDGLVRVILLLHKV